MPSYRPTLATLIRRVVSDVETRLDSEAARLRGRVENALARAVAGVSHGLHGALAYLARQVIWDGCDDEYLVRWAAIFGIYRIPAVRVEGTIITVTGTIGTLVPSGTRWARADGVEYEITAATTLTSSPENLTINAVEAGSAANGPVGVSASLTAPVAGLDSQGLLTLINTGRDIESYAALRFRFLQRLRQPPSGGGPGDYIRWARTSVEPTPTRVWEGGKVPTPGWVTVWAVDDFQVFPGINLAPGDAASLLTHIETLAPLHMHDRIIVESPTLTTLPVEITIVPNTAEMKAAVSAALDLEIRQRTTPGGTMRKGWLDTAVGKVPGLHYHVMSAPAADVTYAEGEIAIFSPDTDLTFLP